MTLAPTAVFVGLLILALVVLINMWAKKEGK